MLTFAHDTHGRLRAERGERWDRAERALIRDLGWVDAFRVLHGYEERSASWTFKDDRGGWRLDHVLVSGLEVVASAYAHDWRRAGLSDHSALVVDLTARLDDLLRLVERERGRQVAVGVDLRLAFGELVLGLGERVGAGDEPKRRPGSSARTSSARASLAGSPPCLPFMPSQNSRWAALRSA